MCISVNNDLSIWRQWTKNKIWEGEQEKKPRQDSEIPNASTKNQRQEPQSIQGWNEMLILWKQLWHWTYYLRRRENKGRKNYMYHWILWLGLTQDFHIKEFLLAPLSQKGTKKLFFPWLITHINLSPWFFPYWNP